ncbi:hypothetical protein G6F23_014106 [Rhizopus arrhizus]|nr:hypothetical protein G6F23_014106 [Rhizopus arrhizus]
MPTGKQLHPPAKRHPTRRKTPRKLPEAARAAGRERAPQDSPPPNTGGENPKHTVLPSRREIAIARARRGGPLGCAGSR